MPDNRKLALTALGGLRTRFEAAAVKRGPLRCLIVHREGEDLKGMLLPPHSENVPILAGSIHALYSYRVYRRDADGKEVLCKAPTIGTGFNPYLTLNEKVCRHEDWAARRVLLLRSSRIGDAIGWSEDEQALRADPEWQRVSALTSKSAELLWQLAKEAGKCFDVDAPGDWPGIARESFQAHDDGLRWLWIVFDLAWLKVPGSPLRAERWVWHEEVDGPIHQYAYELDFQHEWQFAQRHGDAKRLYYLEEWARHRPGFYYSRIDDVFSASAYAIDLLAAASAPPESKQVPWRDDALEYLPLTEARKLIDNRLGLSTLSKLLTADGEIHYMRKQGVGCKVHVADFRRYMQSRQNDPQWAKAYLDFREAVGKGDRRWFWRCKACRHEYAENATAPERCPKCKGEVELTPKAPPKPRR